VSTFEVDTWRTVNFWTEKLTDVLIWSFSKIDVSSVMRIETQGLKNKVVKTQGLKRCLTHINEGLPFLFININRTEMVGYRQSTSKIGIRKLKREEGEEGKLS
jgi:hypothetical protein